MYVVLLIYRTNFDVLLTIIKKIYMRFKRFLCVRAYKCTYVRSKMIKLALYTNGIYTSENVPNISENFSRWL